MHGSMNVKFDKSRFRDFKRLAASLCAPFRFDTQMKRGMGAVHHNYDKSLARPERKQATATEDFEFHISYL